MEIEKVFTQKAPEPAGHYSQAVVVNGFVFISGQLPVVPVTGEKISGTIEDQTLQVLKNIEAIAVASGSNKLKIVKVNVYITDIAMWGEVNKVYCGFFGDNKPARAVVTVKELHWDAKIEMDAIAVL